MYTPKLSKEDLSKIVVSKKSIGGCLIRRKECPDDWYEDVNCSGVMCLNCTFYSENSTVEYVTNLLSPPLTFDIPDGYEIDKEKTTSSKIILKEKLIRLEDLSEELLCNFDAKSKLLLNKRILMLALHFNKGWKREFGERGWFIGVNNLDEVRVYNHISVSYGLPYFKNEKDAKSAIEILLKHYGHSELVRILRL